MSKYVLVTGGAGYIGSHALVEMTEAGYTPVVVDNLCNSCRESVVRAEEIVGRKIAFFEADVCDYAAIKDIFSKYRFFAVVHFAGLKAVGESVSIPLKYYENNLFSTINLLKVMQEEHCHNFVFSSSATVYGDPERLPLTEDCRLATTNPYGATKLMIENILKDLRASDKKLNIIILRYFNPIGAHKSGLIGEEPQGIPNNLLPYICKVASGELAELNIYGNDYPTRDGTGCRDYIHVVDLARGHVAALDIIEGRGLDIFNLGTGVSYSVLEVVRAFEKASGQKIRYRIVARREGDIAECYADCGKAKKELHWKAQYGLDEMCEDLWRWQSKNPRGYNK